MPPVASAADYFAAKLRFETDPADLAADRAAGRAPLLIDVRSDASWAQGRIPGAVHLERADFDAHMPQIAAEHTTVLVVYCWGPGCNGSTRAALRLSELGYSNVRELIGGYEYWVREGFATESEFGRQRGAIDRLTAPVAG